MSLWGFKEKAVHFLQKTRTKANNKTHTKLIKPDAKTSERKKVEIFILLHISIPSSDRKRNFF